MKVELALTIIVGLTLADATAPAQDSRPTVRPTPPKAVRRVAPEYSDEARASDYQGDVIVSATVDESGAASDFRIVRGLGLGLDAKAMDAVTQWQFTPGTQGGSPVRMRETFAVEFELPGGSPWRLEGAYFTPSVYVTESMMGQKAVPVTQPAIKRYVSPEASACSPHLTYALLKVHIGKDGLPSEVTVQQSSTDAAGQAATAAAQSWTFEPARAEKKRIESDGTIFLECRAPEADIAADSANKPEHVGRGVTPPVVIFQLEPGYSEEARQAKYQGTAVLSVVVDRAGKPTNISVYRALGLGLDEKAMEAVAQWRFRPGMKDGKAVRVAATIQVNFKLL